ncbi:unnamed protein product [Lymnaea stagnalis]|uniref:G-protein coupled receptors family 1 profile domain-containing protein n=1 Tax=Lymnaea stagnalis TaxID=6523 RepID=A0AAV2H3A5_LYMST
MLGSSEMLDTFDVSSNISAQTPSTRPAWELHFEQTLAGNVSCYTKELQLPEDMRFTQDTLVSVVAYCFMFVVALVGNLTVLVTVWGSRNRSRVNMCVLHLTVADLFVTCVFMPMETSWHITVSWQAGDLACRICMVFRAFGFYLSSYIIVVISLDRYFSIVHPLTICDAENRCKIMLWVAYTASFISSFPQSIIFHVETHPTFKWFSQCVTFNFFPTPTHELAYLIFNCVAVYLLPLVVILTCYLLIFLKISQQHAKHKKHRAQRYGFLSRYFKRIGAAHTQLLPITTDGARNLEMRCSTTKNLSKAKMKTLKMTLLLVSIFLLCWTPYFAILAFHWISKEQAMQLDPKVQRFLFVLAVSNACFDPLVYGMFTSTFITRARRWRAYIHQRFTRQSTVTTT